MIIKDEPLSPGSLSIHSETSIDSAVQVGNEEMLSKNKKGDSLLFISMGIFLHTF